jgi:hypothetical protein
MLPAGQTPVVKIGDNNLETC